MLTNVSRTTILHVKYPLICMILSPHSVLQGGKNQANCVENVINFQKVQLPQEVIANNVPVYDHPLQVGYPGAPFQKCYLVLEMTPVPEGERKVGSVWLSGLVFKSVLCCSSASSFSCPLGSELQLCPSLEDWPQPGAESGKVLCGCAHAVEHGGLVSLLTSPCRHPATGFPLSPLPQQIEEHPQAQ